MGQLSHLDELEAEAIYIIREVAAECEKPVMLYSIGKDSSVMLHLAMKAFYPEKPPFPFLHVNTTWKFKEMIEFRDYMAKKLGIEMIEYINEEGVKQGINPFDHGSAYTDIMKTQALKQALDKYGFTAAFGGGRRDEEKSRAKERIFSFRNEHHAWDPKNQRPEMWKLYNSKIKKKEEVRVFPLSNWTEKDIWQYIKRENIEIPSLYFAKVRPVVYRDGNIIMVDDDRFKFREGEKVEMKKVRFRTLGCYPLTGGVESDAVTLDEVRQKMEQGEGAELFTPLDQIFAELPAVTVTDAKAWMSYNGNDLPERFLLEKEEWTDGQEVRVYDSRKNFIGLYQYRAPKKLFHIKKMFLDPEAEKIEK